MSFDVFVQAFHDGHAGLTDADAVRAVLAPHVVGGTGGGGARLVTSDGGADLFGYDDLDTGFMVNHIEGSEAWELIVRAAAASGLAIMPVGCPVCVTADESVSDLPAALAGDARVVESGAALLAVVRGAG